MIATRSIAYSRRRHHTNIIGRALHPILNVLVLHHRAAGHHGMPGIARDDAAKRKLGERKCREDS